MSGGAASFPPLPSSADAAFLTSAANSSEAPAVCLGADGYLEAKRFTTMSPKRRRDVRRRRRSDETLVTLREKLEDLPERSAERQRRLQGCADLHGVSVATV